MRMHTLKINQRHLKNELEEGFFYYLDVYHRCLAVSIIYHGIDDGDIVPSTIMENSHYNSLLRDMKERFRQGYNILEEIHSKYSLDIYMDTQIYLEEFLKAKHNKGMANVYSLTLDNKFNLVITNKQLGRRYLLEE